MSRVVSRQARAVESRIAARSSNFTPKEVNPIVWLDAADEKTVILEQNKVKTWVDKSNNKTNVSSLPRTRPTYNKNALNKLPSIKFDRKMANYLAGQWAVNTYANFSVFMVVKWLTFGNSLSEIQILIDNNHTATLGFVWQDRPDVQNRPINTQQVISPNQVGNGTWKQLDIEATKDRGGFAFENKKPLVSTLNTAQGPTFTRRDFLSIGNWAQSINFPIGRALDGEIAEVIIADSLSEQQLGKMRTYLSNKWNLK